MARAVKKFLRGVRGSAKLLYRSCFFAVCRVKQKACALKNKHVKTFALLGSGTPCGSGCGGQSAAT